MVSGEGAYRANGWCIPRRPNCANGRCMRSNASAEPDPEASACFLTGLSGITTWNASAAPGGVSTARREMVESVLIVRRIEPTVECEKPELMTLCDSTTEWSKSELTPLKALRGRPIGAKSELAQLRALFGRNRPIGTRLGVGWVVMVRSNNDQPLLRLVTLLSISWLKRRLLGRGGGGMIGLVGCLMNFFAWHSLNMPLSHEERGVNSIVEQMATSMFCLNETASASSVF